MNLSQKLRELRTLSKLSQEQLAQKLNVTNQAVSKWEVGKSYPDILNLVKICDIYNVSLDELIRSDIKFQKNLSNKNRIKDIYVFFIGILFICLSFFIFLCFINFNMENSLTNFIVTMVALVGFALIYKVLIKKVPKKIRDWFGIE